MSVLAQFPCLDYWLAKLSKSQAEAVLTKDEFRPKAL